MSQRTSLKTIRTKVVSVLFRQLGSCFGNYGIAVKTQFLCTLSEYAILFALSAQQGRKACQMLSFLPVSKAHRNKLYIFQLCTYIVYLYSHWQHNNLLLSRHYMKPWNFTYNFKLGRGCRGRNRMVVGWTTIYAIGAHHHWCCGFNSRSGWGVQHYVIKFVRDLRQDGGFLWVLRFPPPIKLTTTI